MIIIIIIIQIRSSVLSKLSVHEYLSVAATVLRPQCCIGHLPHSSFVVQEPVHLVVFTLLVLHVRGVILENRIPVDEASQAILGAQLDDAIVLAWVLANLTEIKMFWEGANRIKKLTFEVTTLHDNDESLWIENQTSFEFSHCVMLAFFAMLLDLLLGEDIVDHVLKFSVMVSFFAHLGLINVQEDVTVQSRRDMTMLTFELSFRKQSKTLVDDSFGEQKLILLILNCF